VFSRGISLEDVGGYVSLSVLELTCKDCVMLASVRLKR